MVISAINIADLFEEFQKNEEFGRAGELRRQFIGRRNVALYQVMSKDFRKSLSLPHMSLDYLYDQLYLINGLSLEASKMDDEYRLYSPFKQSDPNYEGLITVYNGIRNLIRKEIRHREIHSRTY